MSLSAGVLKRERRYPLVPFAGMLPHHPVMKGRGGLGSAVSVAYDDVIPYLACYERHSGRFSISCTFSLSSFFPPSLAA